MPEDNTETVDPLPFGATLCRIRLTLEFESGGRLARYPGSAIRGLLGHGLRKTLCVTRQSTCNNCPLLTNCGYARFFESPAIGKNSSGRYSAMPHPWVLDLTHPTPRRVEAGDQLQFGITLLGEAANNLPWIVLALDHAGTLGFGGDRATFRLTRIEQESLPGNGRWQEIDRHALPRFDIDNDSLAPAPPAPDHVTISLQTPLRLKHHGKLVKAADFGMAIFLRALRLRLRELGRLYASPAESATLPEIPDDTEAALIDRRVTWQDWTRWSNRQKTHMQLGGLIGEIDVDLSLLEGWWPPLWQGQWLHMGKQTSMGLGQYRLLTSL
ncbi:MAG TPA: CRISPR system precrRNA processing endoribonuclease RAMP protein Cas6 [Gammaproteobacteria bacterium]|nr:CRISPR system precrRNA processing endoribonuclease RAMP protein Cas6 [Gammaproteobacteria bacterium]